MYKNMRASHTVQPLLSQLLQQSELVTIMHGSETAFILLPWSVYCAFRSLLSQQNYVDPQLMEPLMVGISHMAKRFLSFQKLEETFHQSEQGTCNIVFVLKRNTAVGALIRYNYYLTLIAFLQERQLSGLEPFLTEVPHLSKCPDRLLSLTAFRNLSMRLPFLFAEEQQKQGGNLPFIVTRQRQPALVVFSWETWQRVLELFLPDNDWSEEDCELINQLVGQMQNEQ